MVVAACPREGNIACLVCFRERLTACSSQPELFVLFLQLFLCMPFPVDPGDSRSLQRDLHASERRRRDQVGAPRVCRRVSARIGRLSVGRRFRGGKIFSSFLFPRLFLL